LLLACLGGHTELVQWLVDTKGADIEAKTNDVSNHSITTHTHT